MDAATPRPLFRFNPASRNWSLYCPNFGQKNSWRPYPDQPSRDLNRLIATIDTDPNGAFWGRAAMQSQRDATMKYPATYAAGNRFSKFRGSIVVTRNGWPADNIR